MMTDQITKLSMSGFRGASGSTTITFDAKKTVAMIFGENGSGKSCIVDAIDLIANQSAGSLGERSSTSVKSHLPTIGMKPSDVAVELTCGRQTWNGSLSGSKARVKGPDPRPRVHILRRSQLLTLIEAQPAKRYEELRRFIDVGGVEKSEQALREAATAANNEMTQSARDVTDADLALEELWTKEGAKGKSAREWAKSKITADQTALLSLTRSLGSLITLLETLKQAEETLEKTERIAKDAQGEVTAVEKEIKERPGPSATDAVELITVLESAHSYIAEPRDFEQCPVCEQTVVADDLREAIKRRLTNMTEFRELSQTLETADSSLQLAQADLERSTKSFIKAAVAVAQNWRANHAKLVQDVDIQWDLYQELLAESGTVQEQVWQAKSFSGIVLPHTDTITESRDEAQADIARYNAIKGYYDRIIDGENKAQELETLSKRLDRALTIAHDKRIEYTQGILDEVAGECNRLYRELHPAESLGDSKLKLDPLKKASLHQEAAFEGHAGVPPQAYFSDSHLDTLGFCVWLSIAKREDPANTIIVLDDVFTSVDSPHLTRIVNLLADESKSFRQIIVTTHYRNWRDRYRLAQGAGKNVHLLELHRWTLQRGVVTSRTKLAIDELESKVKSVPLDRQAVSSQAGILLEAMLDRLALQYRCRVAHTPDGDLTLGELFEGCNSLFKKLCVEQNGDGTGATPADSEPTLQQLLAKINELGFIRNQVGCHFNLAGGDISDSDVEEFGLRTVTLGRALTCSACGDIPHRGKGTHFECCCGEAKMTPLEK